MDSREPKSYQAAVRQAAGERGVAVDVIALPTGDYTWCREDGVVVVVERKTVGDLLSSLRDGRWQEQLPRLVGADVPILLLEGNLVYRADGQLTDKGRVLSGWTVDGVDGALLVGGMAGVLVAHAAPGPAATARRLLALHVLTSRDTHTTLTARRARIITLNANESAAVGLLTALPGCGEKTARKLLGAHGSVDGVIGAISNSTVARGIATSQRLAAWKRVLDWQTGSKERVA